MNQFSRSLIASLILAVSTTTFAINTTTLAGEPDPIEKLVEYFVNFGGYMGLKVEDKPSSSAASIIDPTKTQVLETSAFAALFGAIPFSKNGLFLPSGSFPAASFINPFANYTFKDFAQAGGYKQGKISAIDLIDQKSYKSDPVSQAVYNILATPDDSYCMNNDGTQLKRDCNFFTRNNILENVIGKIPSTEEFFSNKYIQNFLTELNGNTLIAPLFYNSSQTGVASSKEKGVTAQNQAQAAANFIRYATGAIKPFPLADRTNYDTLYIQANTSTGSAKDRLQAQQMLTGYLTDLRVYSAQLSVGFSNLYAMLSKRMRQDQNVEGDSFTSQAKSEFDMATWRLYNPEKKGEEQWVQKLNKATPATVQKEIAILLSEINYQLYLSRQQDERLLLTNTLTMMQNVRLKEPSITSGDAE